jgi:fumarate hydratase class II
LQAIAVISGVLKSIVLKVTKTAFAQGITLKQAAVDLGLLTPEEFDAWVIPERMVSPIAD